MSNRKRRRKLKTSVKITALILIFLIAMSGYVYVKVQEMRSYTEPEGKITDTKDDTNKDGKISPIGGDEDDTKEIPKLTYKVYDLDQGEAILVKTDEKVVLIDTGSNKSKKKLVKKIDEDTAGEIDYLILTSDDPERIGGIKAIKKNFTVKNVLYGDMGMHEREIRTLFKDSELMTEKETTIDLGHSATIMTLMPKNRSTDKNDSSIICNVIYGETTFWSMSNAGAAEEKKIIETMGDDVSVFVPARRADDTTNYILKVMEPAYVAIPLNKGDKVSDKFLNRCSSSDIYDTQKCGDLVFESNKSNVTLYDYDILNADYNLANR